MNDTAVDGFRVGLGLLRTARSEVRTLSGAFEQVALGAKPSPSAYTRMMLLVRSALAGVCAALCLLLAATSSAEAATKGFWGPAEVNGVSQFPIYRNLGVTLYQKGLGWASIAPTRPANPTDPNDPAYRWPATMDSVIREARQNNMRVLLLINTSPGWANGGKGPEWAPSPTAYAQFATAAARRYPAVRQWMIWGEPSRAANFQPLVRQTIGRPLTPRQAAAPKRYARILDAAYGALKRVRRSNVVIGGNTFTAGDIRPVKWVQHMRLPNGRRPRLDVYGHNPFTLRTPNLKNPPGAGETVDFSDLGRFQKVINRAFGRRSGKVRRVPLFLSEFSVPTALDSEFNFFTTRAKQAQFITKGFRIARQLKVYGFGWIHLYDEGPDDNGIRGGLIDINGKRKPGFAAFRAGRL
ncbi:MAG: hypothetical protein WKF96_09825 [Solirubrobacteraceae bacterium]